MPVIKIPHSIPKKTGFFMNIIAVLFDTGWDCTIKNIFMPFSG
jgi:hypothetical protein